MALPCVVCGCELEDVGHGGGDGNQPYAGTAFQSHGHYGSTIYDPMDGRYIEINICDPCLRDPGERVREGQSHRLIIEGGCVVGSEEIPPREREPLTPWEPFRSGS